jgi:phosphohistidine phosphatase SixA
LRNAKSSWKEDFADYKWGLNKRGKKDLPAMVKHLKNINIEPP